VKKLFAGPIAKDSTPKISRAIGAIIIKNPVATMQSMNTLQNPEPNPVVDISMGLSVSLP
jgi:hypothetical protein